MNPIPLSLYIHIPWCVRKCPYCDFNSHESQHIPEQEYITALLNDLKQDAPFAQQRQISTIFIGGGTPSLCSAQSYDILLNGIDAIVPIAKHAEITLEANPGTFEFNKFRDYRKTGINRLSIGVQSFASEKLLTLGRIHNSDEAVRAIQTAQDVGFDRLNIDLMHGLPNQTQNQALADLEQALSLKPSHLSWYQLTIEPNTHFYSKPPTLPKEDTLCDIEESGKVRLAQAGFTQYETSAYCKPGFQCAHNLNYWQFGDYLTIGAGAHGKISNDSEQTIRRYQKKRLPKDYLNPEKPFTAKSDDVLAEDLPFEFFMNAFRLHQAIPKSLFQERTFLSLSNKPIQANIQSALNKGLISETETHWQTTELGNRFLNSLLELFS